jgi:hypothetical protein
MVYYHLRYNIYPSPGFPVEKEEWTVFPIHLDETAVNKILQEKYHTSISVIVCSVICQEEYLEQMEKQDKYKAAILN